MILNLANNQNKIISNNLLISQNKIQKSVIFYLPQIKKIALTNPFLLRIIMISI